MPSTRYRPGIRTITPSGSPDGTKFLKDDFSWAVPPGSSSATGLNLTSTTTKVAADSPVAAVAGQYIRCDTTAGNIVVNLPTGQSDKACVAVKMVAGTGTVTVNRGGSDVIDVAGTTVAITLTGRTLVFQFVAAGTSWSIIAGYQSIAGLNGLYELRTGGGATGLVTPANHTGAVTLSVATGNYIPATLTGNPTYTFPSGLGSDFYSFVLELTQDGTGGRVPVWPGNVTWDQGISPNMDTDPLSPSGPELLQFISRDGGTTWRGFHVNRGAQVLLSSQAGDYTLALQDRQARVRMTAAAANTVTVPPHTSVPFRLGDWIDICQMGVGTTTIVQGAGVTVLAPNGVLQLNSQYATVRLIQDSLNTWVMDRGGVGQAPSGGVQADPAIINQTSVDTGAGGTSHSITFTAATAGSDLVVAFRGGANTNAPSGITAGWTLVKEAYGATAAGGGIHVYAKFNCAGGETTFAYTTASAENHGIQYWEVRNLVNHAADKLPAAVDQSGNTSALTLHATTTGQLTAAKEFALLAVAVIPSSPSQTTVNQSFTMRNAGTQFRMQCADRLTIDTTALDPTLTYNGASRSVGVLVTLS